MIPLLLILVCPPTALVVWYTHTHLGGSLAALAALVSEQGIGGFLYTLGPRVLFGSAEAWTIIAVFGAFQLALMRLLPGPPFEGPPTRTGHVPVYKANGPLAFAVTMGAFLGGSALGLFSPTIAYDHFGEILGALNVFSLLFCVFLLIKGRTRPSPGEHGTQGDIIRDYFWGTELYPRIFGFDVKMFTNCRFGMMAWPVLLLSFAAKQRELYGLSDSMIVAVAIQMVYLAKFYWWETGYLRTLDIMHDRAGFYLCWGCLVWVPAIYTSSTLYLVHHPHELGLAKSLAIGTAGVGAVLVNYVADAQKLRVRLSNGRCTVWGKEPELIIGRYRTEDGQQRQSLLLCSGFWGLARHFHYLPELLGAFLWTLPAGFAHALPWFYFTFLTILLLNRLRRDELRCSAKYGPDWEKYRARVPYVLVPKVF